MSHQRSATIACGVVAAALLATGNTRWIARSLGALVALMGIAFLLTAVRLGPDFGALLAGLLVPRMPAGSMILVLGLVGTTVVPYNLFLGSALARDHDLGEMRWGLTLAIIGGGLISLGVLVVGSALGGGLEYERLAEILTDRLGHGAEWSLAVGLFGAGLTSAVTAPLAGAITARTLLGESRDEGGATIRGGFVEFGSVCWRRGFVFGATGVKPIPVIILAQAFNGLVSAVDRGLPVAHHE